MKEPEMPGDAQFPLSKSSMRPEDDIPQDPLTSAKPPSRFRRFWRIAKWTSVISVILVCTVAGTVFGKFYSQSSFIRHIINSWNAGDVLNTVTRFQRPDPFLHFVPKEQFPSQQQKSINVLLLGCDSDYMETKPIEIKGSNGRSDSIMIAHVDFEKQTVNVISIPRDTAVPIPGQRGFHKVNGAHSFGGNDLSTRTISEDFGIPIDYTLSLHFGSFEQVVDALGGVDLNVKKKLDYDDNWGNLHVHLKPGMQHLNGYKALGYVRIRHSDSDLARAERQHEFIEALRMKMTQPQNFMLLPTAINKITEDLKSNLNEDQMITLVNFARHLPKGNLHLDTLPNYEGRSYVYALEQPSAEMIGKMFFDGDIASVKLNVASKEAVDELNGGRKLVYRTGGGVRRRRRNRSRSSESTIRQTPSAAGDSISTPASSSDSNQSQGTTSHDSDTAPRSGEPDKHSGGGAGASEPGKKEGGESTSGAGQVREG